MEIETSQPEAHRNRTLLQLAGGGAWPSSSADRCADRCNARPDPPDLRPPPTFWIRPPLKPSLSAFSKIQREQQDGNQINTRTKQKKKGKKERFKNNHTHAAAAAAAEDGISRAAMAAEGSASSARAHGMGSARSSPSPAARSQEGKNAKDSAHCSLGERNGTD